MKKLSLLAVLAVALLFAGCSDVLEDVDPSTSISDEEAVSTEEGVDLLRASLYSTMRGSFAFTTQNLVGPGAFADESRTRTGATRFQDLNTAVGTSGTSHLTNYGPAFNLIQNANVIIGGIEDGVLDQGTLDQYRGEALALRAYAYHNLVRAYGYEPGNFDQGPEGNWDLAVPLRTEPVFEIDDVDERPRATVDEIYEQIFTDLQEASDLLAGTINETFVNETFVEGLKARAHLYAGNWEEAAEHAENAINMGPALVDSPTGIADMFFEGGGDHPEALFKIEVNPNTEPIAGSNVNDGLAAYTSIQWTAQLPTVALLSLYDEDDYRLGAPVLDDDGELTTDPQTGTIAYEGGWFRPCFNTVGGNQQGCDAVNELGLTTTKWNGDKGNLADDIPLMRVSEMYLIYAEARARAENDPNAGADVLQALRDARNAGDIPAEALTSMEAFEDEILDERMRELNFEGHRYWDLKRLGRDIPQVDGSIKMAANSFRILAPIGNTNLNANPALEENPGY